MKLGLTLAYKGRMEGKWYMEGKWRDSRAGEQGGCPALTGGQGGTAGRVHGGIVDGGAGGQATAGRIGIVELSLQQGG